MKKSITPAQGSIEIEWAGEILTLLPELAVWWAKQKTLFIADPHFGKASSFRFAGIPVPESPHHDDLARLTGIIAGNAVKTLVILGDFLHAKTGRSAATLSALTDWRKKHPRLKIVLITGNHDRHAGSPIAEWNIECVTGPWILPPFSCRHEPPAEVPEEYTLAGHIHPSFGLEEKTGPGFKAPCFYFGPKLAILPAFGTFTGTHRIRPLRGDRVFVSGPGEVIDVSKLIPNPSPRKKRTPSPDQ